MSKGEYEQVQLLLPDPVSTMCRFFGVSRGGYYDYIKRMDQAAQDTALAAIIRKQ